MTAPIFGLPKYKEIDLFAKLLRKAKTSDDKKRLKFQIDYLKTEIKKKK